MPETDLTPIDNVLTSLDGIINDCILRNDPLGYFCMFVPKGNGRRKSEN
jgi:hypothetical protein